MLFENAGQTKALVKMLLIRTGAGSPLPPYEIFLSGSL